MNYKAVYKTAQATLGLLNSRSCDTLQKKVTNVIWPTNHCLQQNPENLNLFGKHDCSTKVEKKVTSVKCSKVFKTLSVSKKYCSCWPTVVYKGSWDNPVWRVWIQRSGIPEKSPNKVCFWFRSVFKFELYEGQTFFLRK